MQLPLYQEGDYRTLPFSCQCDTYFSLNVIASFDFACKSLNFVCY